METYTLSIYSTEKMIMLMVSNMCKDFLKAIDKSGRVSIANDARDSKISV